jgi:hypothetical protein
VVENQRERHRKGVLSRLLDVGGLLGAHPRDNRVAGRRVAPVTPAGLEGLLVDLQEIGRQRQEVACVGLHEARDIALVEHATLDRVVKKGVDSRHEFASLPGQLPQPQRWKC